MNTEVSIDKSKFLECIENGAATRGRRGVTRAEIRQAELNTGAAAENPLEQLP